MRRSVLLLPALLAPLASAAGQPATVRGVVRAQGGTPLAGAVVTLRPGGGADTTDAAGRFTLGAPPGGATLEVRRVGYSATDLTVDAGASEVAVTLAPLSQLGVQYIVAPRERPLLNTADAATGGAVERTELERLPTDARDPIALAYNIPGVAQATAFFGDAPRLSINGANSLYTQYSLDGLENNEGFLGGPRVELPLSGLQRLAVLANTYSTDLGRSSNGVVNAVSRSGGDAWTGEAFYYTRPGLTADLFGTGLRFDARSKIPLSADQAEAAAGFERRQVGAAGGGPLVAGRTYAFGALEYTDEREDRIASTAQARFTGRELRRTYKALGRVDHGWGPGQSTTLRVAFSDVNREGEGSGIVAPEADIVTHRAGVLAALVHRSELADGRGSNTASVQYGGFRWDFPPARSNFSTPQVTIVAPDSVTQLGVVGSSNFVFDERERQVQLRDVVEVPLGERHLLRAGVDVASSRFALAASSTNPVGAYVVIDDGNIPRQGARYAFADVPADVRVVSYAVDVAQKQVDLSQTLYGAFVEDRWRVTPSLTVQLGLRWDYDDLTSRGASSPDLDNVQPRASFNWVATPEMVVRGGLGLYAGRFPYAVYSDAIQFGAEGNFTATFRGAQAPRFLQGVPGASLDRDTLPPGEVRELFALGLEQPMSTQLSLGWQRQFGDRVALSLDGVLTDTRHLPRSWDLNASSRRIGPADTVNLQPEAGDAFRPVRPAPGGYRRLTTTESGGRARYAGLYTALTYRATGTLLVDGNWVWSRSRTDTEDINFNATQGNDFAAEYADAVNDRRHKVTVRTTYTGIKRLTLATIGDFQTGSPVNRVAFFRDLDGSGGTFGNGFLGNQDRFFGVPRNGERLPSAFVTSLSAAYAIPVRTGDVELRADVFNLFNSRLESGFANGIPGGGARTQVGRPGDAFVFGTVAPPRQVQLSARVLFR